jgi:hypothetical protein
MTNGKNSVVPTRHRAPVNRGRSRAFAVVLVLSGALVLGACGSTAPAVSAPSSCAKVSAVLSDGPDPDADPIGYAEAQVAPLRAVTTSNPHLHVAITELADAYALYFTTSGSKAASGAVARASTAVDAICPGVTS